MKSLRMYLLLLLLLGGIGAYADDVEFDVASEGWNVSYSGTANVTLKGRTFTKGEWSGFCLPFDASKETLDAALGEGCYSLQAYSSFADNKIQFTKVTAATAGTPYFIYLNKTMEDPKFNNVTFVSDVNLGYGGYSADWRGTTTISANLQFRGFYYKKANYNLYNNSSDQTNNAYYLSGDGILQDVRKGEYTDSPLGIDVCILITGYSSSFQKPTVVFEEDDVINSGGTSGGGSGGESGSTDAPTSLTYKIKNKLQLTDVPTLYIDIEGVGSTDTDLDKALFKNRQTGEAPYQVGATITLKDNGSDKDTKHLAEFTDKVDIKVRGNSTANPTNGKKAYRLKFPKKHKHDLLGLGYEKRNWALLANVFDHSMIRNALSYHLEKEVGLDFCPGYKFVDLVINGNYRGTYQICDHVETGTNRVDVDEDAGWMVEFQGRGDMLDQPLCFNQDGLQMNIKNPEPADETNAEEVATFIAPFQEWFTKTWSPQWKATDAYGANSGWRSVNDEESLMKFWIATELTGDYDGWMTVKAYKEADEAKLHYGPVWDKDLAYGNYGGEQSAKLVSNNGNGSSLVTFLNESLLKDPIFTKKLKAKLDQLLSDGLYEKMCAKIDDLAAIVAQTEELSNTKFPRSSKVGEETNNYETYAETITPLKDYLKTRFETVQSLLNKLCEAANIKIEKVTYKPGNAWWSTGLEGYDFGNGNMNMNRLTDAQVDNRTYKANEWNSFCLPFDVSMDQMKTVFGNDVEVVNHVGMDTDAKTMLFAPVSETMLYAGEPYLVKFSGSDVVNPTFKDVIITQTANQKTEYNGKGVSFDGKHTFYGTLFQGYNIKTLTDYLFSNDVYATDASLAKATSITENGARAFIRVSDGTTPAIKIQTADEASKFTYDVTNGYVHTAWCQYDNQTKNVTIENRGTLHAGEWNMMCLPFKLSAAGYKKAFGEDVKVAEFTGVTKSEGGELVSFNLAYINEKNGMKAATPYLIKPSKEIPMADVTFEGVKVSAKTTEEQATGDVNCKLIGTLQPTILDKGHQQLVLKARNELQYMAPNSTTPMQACRAYFELTGTVAAAKNFSFSIDGETTGVKVIDVNAPSASTNTRVYNMNGQLVGTSVENLPQGIYVIAGKKVVK